MKTKIRCPNCDYEGAAKSQVGTVSNVFFWLSVLATIISLLVLGPLSLWPWFFLFVWLIMGLVTAFITRRAVCPKCEWKYPVKL